VLAAELPEQRRGAGAFAAALFLAETKWRAPQRDDGVAHAALALAAVAARASGAWTAAGAEGLRLRALVLLWQTAARGSFARELDAADRAWLLRDDFFAIEPRRTQALHAPARVLRLQLAQGTPGELAALQQLVAMEEAWVQQAAGPGLSADDAQWRSVALDALARYHAERRSFDRAQTYVDRLAAKDALLWRALLALQREDHAQATALARELIARKVPEGTQLLAEALEAGGDDGHLAEALAGYEQVLGLEKDPLGLAAAHNGRGDCLQRLAGRLDDAEQAYREALAAASGDAVGAIAERAETEKDLGRLAERRGRAAEALQHYGTALALGETARGQLLGDAFGGSWLRMHEDQTTAIDGVLRTFPAAGDPWLAVRALELGRARGALDVADGGAAAIDPRELQQVVNQRLAATDGPAAAEAAARLDALRAHAATAPRSAVVPSREQLRGYAAAHPQATILLWWLGRHEAWLAVVRGGDVQMLPLAAPAECRASVARAYAAVATPDGDGDALAAAADCLLPPGPARQHLDGAVLAVLDPAMARLPSPRRWRSRGCSTRAARAAPGRSSSRLPNAARCKNGSASTRCSSRRAKPPPSRARMRAPCTCRPPQRPCRA